MRVTKWSSSLAIRLPAALVEALDLKPGDEVEVQVAGARSAWRVTTAASARWSGFAPFTSLCRQREA